jgi:hypothetical protein
VHLGENRYLKKIVGKRGGKRHFGRRKYRRVDNIEVYLKEIGWEGEFICVRVGTRGEPLETW